MKIEMKMKYLFLEKIFFYRMKSLNDIDELIFFLFQNFEIVFRELKNDKMMWLNA